MASQFVTAKKGTLEFEKLINGDFSDTQRALPVQNLRVGSDDEEVTFELVSLQNIKTEFAYLKFVSAKKLLFVLFPIFYFSMRDWVKPVLQSPELECLIIGLIISILCVQIRIDIQDFISGYDRIRGDKGQKVLNRGWKTVAQLHRDLKIFACVALIFSLVPLLIQPARIYSVVLTLALFFAGFKFGIQRRNRFIRDITLAIVAGPCLAYWILPQFNSIYFGVVWGCFVFFALQLEHFQHYFAQTQAREINLVTFKSFDQAPQLLWAVWAASLCVYAIMRFLTSHIVWWGGSILILMVLSWIWRKSLMKLNSPAGSEIDKIVLKGNQLFYTFILLWVADILFQALVAPLVFAWLK